jgi:hypothetical protein
MIGESYRFWRFTYPFGGGARVWPHSSSYLLS